MKKLELAVLFGLMASICLSALAKTADAKESLEEHVLRLHILANSDSIDDQALKLKVRDKVLAYTETLLTDTEDSLDAVEATVGDHLEDIETLAQAEIQAEGYAYDVQAQLVEMVFTDRTYGTLTMPAGTYTALRITIGAAEGQNWWCVMYPSLCVPSAWTVTVDETAEDAFDQEERDVLEHPERYQVKLKCVEWVEKWLHKDG